MKVKKIIKVPGDKSISHRSLIFSSIAKGPSVIKNLLKADDVLHTLNILRNLGVNIIENKNEIIVYGCGKEGLKEPQVVLDTGNSGTGIRLLTGLLAAQPFVSFITGDNSIVQRPMQRIITPLTKMGGKIISKSKGRAPLCIIGRDLKGITYKMPVASAQVKSCILIAGLFAKGSTTVIEPVLTRDHTERMMEFFGIDIKRKDLLITLNPPLKDKWFEGKEILIPGDISSAAYFIIAGLIQKKRIITIKDVGINPRRSGFIDLLKSAGAKIYVENIRMWNNEPVANITVEYSPSLRSFEVSGSLVANVIDEIPILAVLSAFIKGRSVFRDVSELRHKESDRIKAIVENLKNIGGSVKELSDGFIIEGGKKLKSGKIKSFDDHRIVMSFSIAGLGIKNRIKIDRVDSVTTSFPEFFTILKEVFR